MLLDKRQTFERLDKKKNNRKCEFSVSRFFFTLSALIVWRAIIGAVRFSFPLLVWPLRAMLVINTLTAGRVV